MLSELTQKVLLWQCQHCPLVTSCMDSSKLTPALSWKLKVYHRELEIRRVFQDCFLKIKQNVGVFILIVHGRDGNRNVHSIFLFKCDFIVSLKFILSRELFYLRLLTGLSKLWYLKSEMLWRKMWKTWRSTAQYVKVNKCKMSSKML